MTTNQNRYFLRAESLTTEGWIGYNADDITNFNGYIVKTYDVMSPSLLVWVYNLSPNKAYLTVELYVMA